MIKRILAILAVPVLAFSQGATNDYIFQQKPASGPLVVRAVTPSVGKLIGWPSSINTPAAITIGTGLDLTAGVLTSTGGTPAWGDITGIPAAITTLSSATAAGLALMDDANAAAQRTTLGLGTLATQSGSLTNSQLNLTDSTSGFYVQLEPAGAMTVNRSIIFPDADGELLLANGNGSALTALNASNISSGSLALARLAQSGATSGQAIAWNGSAWAPATVSGGDAVPCQSETLSYITQVEAAGGRLDAVTIAALDALIVDGKNNGWWTLADEVGVFLGATLNAQLVKLKTPGATSFTATNMSDSDVDPLTGFGPGSTNSNKYAVSDYVPSTYSRSSSDFCFAVSTFGAIGAGSGNGCVLSSIGGASLFKIVFAANTGGIFGQVSSESTPAISLNGGLQTYSFSSNVITRYLDDCLMSTKSISATTLDQAISLFRSSFNSVFDYATGKIGFVFLGQALSEAQSKAMGAAVRRFETAIGRRDDKPELVAFGDSITWGQGATTVTTGRWSALVANALGCDEFNAGVQGSALMGSAAPAGIMRYADLTRRKPKYIDMMYGTNDAGGTYSSTFRANLDTILAAWIAAGVSPQNITVCSLPWSPSASRSFANQYLFADATRGAALAAGCIYADVFGRTLSNAASDIGGDEIHPTNSGHEQIAKIILEAKRSHAPRGLIGIGRGINIGAAINTDQAISMTGNRWRIDKIILTNASADISASGAVVSIRTASGGGGSEIVSSVSFAGLTTSGKLNTQTLESLAATDVITANPLYVRLGATVHGGLATVDVLVFGECLNP